jgi:hypothetical protein
MEHSYASEHRFVERYLLDELSAEERDGFEEHFFDCRECAAELTATSDFLDAARVELERPETAAPAPSRSVAGGRGPLRWKPAYERVFGAAALAACLLVTIYQNAVTLPRLRGELARADAPAAIPAISLVTGNSRGGNIPSLNLQGAASVLLQVDIPSQDGVSSYTCSLYSPDRRLVWSLDVTAEAAKDTVFLRAPLGSAESGTYTLAVQGKGGPGNAKADVARYSFNLNTGASQPGQ